MWAAPCNDVDQVENIVVIIYSTETAWGLPVGEPIPASVFLCWEIIFLLGVFLHRYYGIVEGEKEGMEVD